MPKMGEVSSGDYTATRAGYLDELAAANIPADVDALKTIIAGQHQVEWASIPTVEQIASAAANSLTPGIITPTFPTGSTKVRVILVSSIHAANQAANTHNISLKIQGQKAAGGYSDLSDLSAQTSLGLVNVAGASDGWVGVVDVSTLVDTSGAAYSFKFIVDSDNAGAVNYTCEFMLALVYRY